MKGLGMLLLQTAEPPPILDQNRRRWDQKNTRIHESVAPRAGFEPTHPNWKVISLCSEIELWGANLTVLDS
jgi:hypothetical protein